MMLGYHDILPTIQCGCSRVCNVPGCLALPGPSTAGQPAARQPLKSSKATGKVILLTADMVTHVVTQHMAEAMEVERAD